MWLGIISDCSVHSFFFPICVGFCVSLFGCELVIFTFADCVSLCCVPGLWKTILELHRCTIGNLLFFATCSWRIKPYVFRGTNNLNTEKSHSLEASAWVFA